MNIKNHIIFEVPIKDNMFYFSGMNGLPAEDFIQAAHAVIQKIVDSAKKDESEAQPKEGE